MGKKGNNKAPAKQDKQDNSLPDDIELVELPPASAPATSSQAPTSGALRDRKKKKSKDTAGSMGDDFLDGQDFNNGFVGRVMGRVVAASGIGMISSGIIKKDGEESPRSGKKDKSLSSAKNKKPLSEQIQDAIQFAQEYSTVIISVIFVILLFYMKASEEGYRGIDTDTLNDPNPYSVMGLSNDASQTTIKKTFKKLALQFHPDKNPDCKTCPEKFAEISKANDKIGDIESRKRFDEGKKAKKEVLVDANSLLVNSVEIFERQIARGNDFWTIMLYDEEGSDNVFAMFEEASHKLSSVSKFAHIDVKTPEGNIILTKKLKQRPLFFPVVISYAYGEVIESHTSFRQRGGGDGEEGNKNQHFKQLKKFIYDTVPKHTLPYVCGGFSANNGEPFHDQNIQDWAADEATDSDFSAPNLGNFMFKNTVGYGSEYEKPRMLVVTPSISILPNHPSVEVPEKYRGFVQGAPKELNQLHYTQDVLQMYKLAFRYRDEMDFGSCSYQDLSAAFLKSKDVKDGFKSAYGTSESNENVIDEKRESFLKKMNIFFKVNSLHYEKKWQEIPYMLIPISPAGIPILEQTAYIPAKNMLEYNNLMKMVKSIGSDATMKTLSINKFKESSGSDISTPLNLPKISDIPTALKIASLARTFVETHLDFLQAHKVIKLGSPEGEKEDEEEDDLDADSEDDDDDSEEGKKKKSNKSKSKKSSTGVSLSTIKKFPDAFSLIDAADFMTLDLPNMLLNHKEEEDRTNSATILDKDGAEAKKLKFAEEKETNSKLFTVDPNYTKIRAKEFLNHLNDGGKHYLAYKSEQKILDILEDYRVAQADQSSFKHLCQVDREIFPMTRKYCIFVDSNDVSNFSIDSKGRKDLLSGRATYIQDISYTEVETPQETELKDLQSDDDSEAHFQIISYLTSDPIGIKKQWPVMDSSSNFAIYQALEKVPGGALPKNEKYTSNLVVVEADTDRALAINTENLKLTDLYSQIGFEDVHLQDGFNKVLPALANSRIDWYTETTQKMFGGVLEMLGAYVLMIFTFALIPELGIATRNVQDKNIRLFMQSCGLGCYICFVIFCYSFAARKSVFEIVHTVLGM